MRNSMTTSAENEFLSPDADKQIYKLDKREKEGREKPTTSETPIHVRSYKINIDSPHHSVKLWVQKTIKVCKA